MSRVLEILGFKLLWSSLGGRDALAVSHQKGSTALLGFLKPLKLKASECCQHL